MCVCICVYVCVYSCMCVYSVEKQSALISATRAKVQEMFSKHIWIIFNYDIKIKNVDIEIDLGPW